LVAFTVHVYVFPVVAAVTVNGDAAPVMVRVMPPFVDTHVAVKLVIALRLFAPTVDSDRRSPTSRGRPDTKRDPPQA
jgi:hypothetical protein